MLKGLAAAVSVVASTVLSTVLFRTPLSMQFVLGAILILGAVYVFSNPVPVRSPIPCVGTAAAPTSDTEETTQGENTKELKPLLAVLPPV